MLTSIRLRFGRTTPSDNKFGTFGGVFTPTILTILGAIMYLRLGWVVGNAGLVGAIIIILLAEAITIATGLAVSSVATNTRVGAGGAFAIISQSLGLEIGGSVGIPLFFAQSISVTLYILAFSEGWLAIFPTHSMVVVAIIAFFVVCSIAYISAQFAIKIQYVIMAIIALSLISVFIGYFTAPQLYTPQLVGTFQSATFWETFAIFFPAVTGIMVGISMSGSLRKPRRSLPLGTMSAIFLGMVVYLLLAYWLSRVATPEELVNNFTIMVDKAFWSWAVLGGLLGATFSSALGSLVGAPRVMQALSIQGILPFKGYFSQETESGDPKRALIATGAIAFVILLVALIGGGLDAVAGTITMFFLITYAMLNLVVLIEQTLSMVSFRPTFKIPRFVPLIGLIGCLFVMFLINAVFSIIAIIAVLAMYIFLARGGIEAEQDDVRSGLFGTLARWAVIKASEMPPAVERSWKPAVLVPLDNVGKLTGSYRFLWAMTYPQGTVDALGIRLPTNKEDMSDLPWLTEAFLKDGIYARTTMLDEDNFVNGVRSATQVMRYAFFRPNILFLTLHSDTDLARMQSLVDSTAAYKMGVALLARHPVVELGREHLINIWLSGRAPEWDVSTRTGNNHLALLLSYQLARNWDGAINLCMAVSAEEATHAEDYLQEVALQARLPRTTQVHVRVGAFRDQVSQVPRADLNVFGLPKPADLTFCGEMVGLVEGSCVFVRDSGEENAYI
ncbi:MAG: amino acid permease [Anaerolineae bacterium]|nr:amino acid permease [Anaerolineae bacterium]